MKYHCPYCGTTLCPGDPRCPRCGKTLTPQPARPSRRRRIPRDAILPGILAVAAMVLLLWIAVIVLGGHNAHHVMRP